MDWWANANWMQRVGAKLERADRLAQWKANGPTAMQYILRSLPFYSAERLISPIGKQKQKPVVQETLS